MGTITRSTKPTGSTCQDQFLKFHNIFLSRLRNLVAHLGAQRVGPFG